MKRIRIDLQYDGTTFDGWQKQPGRKTVQGLLEWQLRRAVQYPALKLVGQGRTDAGTHALKQVAHFDCETRVPTERLVGILNRTLPEQGVVTLRVTDAKSDFHARFSAISRTYCYVLHHSPRPPHICALPFCHHVKHELDFEAIGRALAMFNGTHDFGPFCSNEWEGKTTVRRILETRLETYDTQVCVAVKANAFLHNMVRHIVGFLLEIGRGKFAPEAVSTILKDPKPVTGDWRGWNLPPARGLFLVDVEYPLPFQENFSSGRT
ncbi:tRNA pseudouridine(38-40) synthase TruA [bacterium]|nr:tRNA pseudouridine(38-40) synthase TruA [bacterium]